MRTGRSVIGMASLLRTIPAAWPPTGPTPAGFEPLLPEPPPADQHLFREGHPGAVLEATYLRWRNQYGGMKAQEAKRLKELEDENKKLKEIVADLTLDNRMLKHLAEGNW